MWYILSLQYVMMQYVTMLEATQTCDVALWTVSTENVPNKI